MSFKTFRTRTNPIFDAYRLGKNGFQIVQDRKHEKNNSAGGKPFRPGRSGGVVRRCTEAGGERKRREVNHSPWGILI